MFECAYLYILRCADGSLYIGTTRAALDLRIAQHNSGTFAGYTMSRRPVVLVYSEWFDRIDDAIAAERKLKKWTRAKKEAWKRAITKRGGSFHIGDSLILRDARLRRAPQDEGLASKP